MTAVRARENPFRVERLHALRFRFAPADGMESLCARLRSCGGRGAIVGPHGTGKTTLLGELAARLRSQGFRVRALRIGAGTRALDACARARLSAGLSEEDAVLLDGAGHLTPLAWWRARRAARRARFFVVTAHRPGRLPTLLRTSPTPALLAELAAALGAPVRADEARRLFSAARGNLRTALRELYDSHADRAGNLPAEPGYRDAVS